MISQDARLETRTRPTLGRMQLALRGELDMLSAERVRQEARALVDEGWDLVLDLAEISFIDCAGLHALEDVLADADARGRQAFAISPSAAVRRIAELLDEPQLA